jgi:ammonia channel protein AmtB
MGGIFGSILVAISDSSFEGNKQILEYLYPELANGRTLKQQAGAQILALLVTVIIALVSGAFTGFLCEKLIDSPEELFDDNAHFHGVSFPAEF